MDKHKYVFTHILEYANHDVICPRRPLHRYKTP